MTPLEVFLQLGTVFLGAFLAFGFENFRERRQLRGWANEYLKRVRSDLATEEGAQIVRQTEQSEQNHTTFLSLGENHVPSKDEWNSLMTLTFAVHTDHRALLESPAVRITPAELVKTLAELDERMRADDTLLNFCLAAWQQYTVPLVFRQTTLTTEERRGLEYVRELFRLRLEHVRERRKTETRVLEPLYKHNLGR